MCPLREKQKGPTSQEAPPEHAAHAELAPVPQATHIQALSLAQPAGHLQKRWAGARVHAS